MSHGLWQLSALQLVLLTLALTHVTMISVTVYLHRHSAHRAVELHPVLKHFFRFWLWLTTGMNTKEWTAIHRKHHATCETEEDPHSPQVQGIKKIFWEGAEVYRAAATDETLSRYGSGTPEDWVERNVYSRFTIGGVAAMLIIDVALFGVLGLTVWAVQMVWTPVFAAGVINGVGHYWGYRNFECHDAARNILPWGIVIAGEELHNNHHTYPNSAKLSQKPWEFDIGWMYIRLFEMLGLAKARSTGPVVEKVPGKQVLDTDTAWAVLNDRFRVMAKYAEDVVAPLVEQELTRAGNARRSVVRAAKRVLCRDDSLVDAAGQNRISEILDTSQKLQTIYEFKQRLQGVWSKRSAGADELLGELKAWCRDAEATGIQALRDFVAEIRQYSMPQLARA
ncbi:MAG: fatty acid desaturase [Pseudomonadales bacterium]